MSIQIDKQQSLLTDAFEVLLRNLGPQKTSQLWQMLTPVAGDYLRERQKIFKGKTITNISKEAAKFNKR